MNKGAKALKTRNISELIPYSNNARTHSDEQVKQIANSIKEFGFANPIQIDERNNIIAGHGRLQAANLLGLKQVPVVIVEGLTDTQRKALIIADNKIALNAGWDNDLLRVELNELTELDFNIDLLGFSEIELNMIGDDLENSLSKYGKNESSYKLIDKYIEPPFSVLDTTSQRWQDRKKTWFETYGLNDIDARGDSALGKGLNTLNKESNTSLNGTSIFDPILAELAYLWFCPKGGNIIDPFCGGAARGVVAKVNGYEYTGYDIRKEQIDFNYELCSKYNATPPIWVHSDSSNINDIEKYDFIFSCPPYGDIEKYNGGDKDISMMEQNEFNKVYAEIIAKSVKSLKNNSFACFVVGEYRLKNGTLANFVDLTNKAFEIAGCKFYNDIIIVKSIGTLPLRAGETFKNRKIGRRHEYMLVYLKGNAKLASSKLNDNDFKFDNNKDVED